MSFVLSDDVLTKLIGAVVSIAGFVMSYLTLRQSQANHVVSKQTQEDVAANTLITKAVEKQTDGINSKLEAKLAVKQAEVDGLQDVVAHIDERQAGRE